jgi:hypothetical protein
MKSTWMLIVGGGLELAEKIDAATVDLVEARAPTVSLADRDDIVRGFQDGTIFRQVREGMTRKLDGIGDKAKRRKLLKV